MTADSAKPPEGQRHTGRGEFARSAAKSGSSRDGLAGPSASLETLRQRAVLLWATRECFDAQGYWEVETPLLSHDTVVDAWLEPFTTFSTAGDEETELFLQTSPEFGMKRLLAAGARAIYQITRAFRRGEAGRFHNPEFTMIEWYRAGDSYHDQMDFTEGLVRAVFACAAEFPGPHAGRRAVSVPLLPAQPFDRLAYDAAFARHAGTPVLKLSADELARLAERRGVRPPASLQADDRDGWLNLLLTELVEPHLGRERPVFVYDYPATQGALAQIRPGDPPVAERFELYAAGVELCNGFQELTDAVELRERMRRHSEIRMREGLRPLPRDNRLIDAMLGGLPGCAGVALGFDRLAMLALGKSSLAEVTAFPFERA